MGLRGPVELGFRTARGTVAIDLPTEDSQLALQMADRLGRELGAREPGLGLNVATNGYRDIFIQRLFVEGPDQQRFEFNGVAASTRVRDIAQATISQYEDQVWPREKTGQRRPAVVDRQMPDGSTRRLDPDSTLEQSEVRNGDTLHVAPGAQAGSVHPQIREEALARARAQVLTYAAAHAGFEVEANVHHAPTEYLFRFDAPSWAPSAAAGEGPRPISRHEVFLVLPPDFPMQAPQAFWQVPIFHPNIHPTNGAVCLGALADRYRPGLDFGELCQTLVDIAGYQNYEIREGYNKEAQEWALSPEGQMAIEAHGGQSVTRMLLRNIIQDTQEPPPLRIRRLDR
jgi:hypothetical protein